MVTRQITHQNIFRVITAGFALVILLLLAAAAVGIRNIQSIQKNAAGLVRDQEVTNRLIGELHSQQTALSEVFSVLARDPDSVDYDGIMQQLDQADKDIDRICTEGARTPEQQLWQRLRETSAQFSTEARRILSQNMPESFSSKELFRDHEAFIAVIARLIETQYRKVSAAEAEINRLTARLLEGSLLFASASVLLALIMAGITVRMASNLVRGMEWQTAELGRVSFHMLEDQEAAARRFSHELHDELGQSLTAVKANLAAIDGNSARVSDCLRLVDEAIGNVREMSQLLRPTILDDFGLSAGLRWLCEGFGQRTGIDVTCEVPFTGRLPEGAETHLFRIAQEALTNVARHAHAKHVRLQLEQANSHVTLRIADDGCGISPTPSNPRGLGLIGMRARARSAGGDMEIRSRPGEGVLIEVQVPVGHEAHSNLVG
jgi:two-component system sensor histidine kinase UhpB